MALGQTNVSVVAQQGAMEILGRRGAQGVEEQKLTRCALQQVGAAYDFGNFHGSIVNRNRELIRGYIVTPPNNEVAEILAGDETLWALPEIVELEQFVIGHLKSPIHSCRG